MLTSRSQSEGRLRKKNLLDYFLIGYQALQSLTIGRWELGFRPVKNSIPKTIIDHSPSASVKSPCLVSVVFDKVVGHGDGEFAPLPAERSFHELIPLNDRMQTWPKQRGDCQLELECDCN
jgi:hypothetical protein